MRQILELSDDAMAAFRAGLTGERLGWVIFSAPGSYAPVHQVHVDPENGPVVIAGNGVYEVGEDAVVFADEDAARDAYWAARQ